MSEVSVNPGPEAEVLSAEDQVRIELLANIDRVIMEAMSDDTVDNTDYREVEGAAEYLKAGFGTWFGMVEVVPEPAEEGQEPETKEQFAHRILEALDNPPEAIARTEAQSMFTEETLVQSAANSMAFGNWALDIRMDAVAIQNSLDFDNELALFHEKTEQIAPAAE